MSATHTRTKKEKKEIMKSRNYKSLLLCALVFIFTASISAERYRERYDPDEPYGEPERTGPGRHRESKEWDEPRRQRDPEWIRPGRGRERSRDAPFLMKDSSRVVRTDAGEMRVVRGIGLGDVERPLHIGFITMEPKSLFVPQYLDSSLIIFIRRGVAKIGMIYEDDLVERDLKTGDVYRIPAGSVFYLVNNGEGQRLHVVCSIDPSESMGMGPFQSFYIGGGQYPASALQGFDPHTLATAFNVTVGDLDELMTTQTGGPIVYIQDPKSHAPSMWHSFMQLKKQDKLRQLGKLVESEGTAVVGDVEEVEEKWTWSWMKVVKALFGAAEKNRDEKSATTKKAKEGPDSYNLYDRKADFKNNYGWSVALEEHDYSPLQESGISIYLVNLTAGSMMAPHINPTATEYGIVLRGSGSLQIVYPNGTAALNTQIAEGDVFYIPRYFPFCQIASRTGPLEFFGFTTSSRRNRPQFLVGTSSILQTIRGPEIAAAFGVSVERLDQLINAQKEAVILPTAEVAPGDVERDKGDKGHGDVEPNDKGQRHE